MKDSIIAGAAATAVASTGLAAATSSAAPQAEAKRLKLCILCGVPGRPPSEVAKGFDEAEIPNTILVDPLSGNPAWVKTQAQIASWKLPPIKVSSHFINGTVTGPDVDTEYLDLWVKRSLARLAQVGVEIVGVYGAFFTTPEGFSKTKARDQALRFVNSLADHAKQHRMLIALEPMGRPDTMWPLYLDGLAFAREIKRPEIRLMADTAYFIERNQPLENILKAPEYCVHCHTAGVKGQPGVGDHVAVHTRLFEIFRDMGYTRAVSCVGTFVDTTGSGKLQFGVETAKTLQYMRDLRDKVYSKG
jgi:hypothetical protein